MSIPFQYGFFCQLPFNAVFFLINFTILLHFRATLCAKIINTKNRCACEQEKIKQQNTDRSHRKSELLLKKVKFPNKNQQIIIKPIRKTKYINLTRFCIQISLIS